MHIEVLWRKSVIEKNIKQKWNGQKLSAKVKTQTSLLTI